ncbi:MAG TPA: TetR/AcrR family transcriptional regulator [Anaerolineales bacterium]
MKEATALSKGEQTRQVILTAAYDLIIRQGFAATSMRQIAKKSGIALGGIYNHFSSKEDVFRAIIEERHPFFQMIPMLSAVPGTTIEEFVRNAAHTLVRELGRHPEFLNLMLVEIVEFKSNHVPVVFDKFLPMVMPIVQHIAGLQGNLRPIPPFVLARAFLGMFFSYYITELLLGRAMPREMRQMNAMDHFVDIFLHGILSEEAA